MLEKASVDMIYSQAVLEHVDQLESAYETMRLWLKPNGFMSHQIDFKSHETAPEWNGHWKYSDFQWKLIRGKRPFLINREPFSAHVAILQKLGCKLLCEKLVKMDSPLRPEELASRFKSMSPQDLTISDAFILAVKRA